jgi:bacterioferritin
VKEQFEADLAVETEVVEENTIDYLEINLKLIDKLGEQLYLSQLVERPPANG